MTGTARKSAGNREAFVWRLRGHLYRRTRKTGAVPTRAELGTHFEANGTLVDEALRFLADARVLVLDEHGGVLMAHPFSAVPTPYRVETPLGDYWANCAWDAIAIPIILGTDGRTRAECPHTGAQIDLVVSGGRAALGDGVDPGADAESIGEAGHGPPVILLPVPARHFWDDIGFT